MIKVYSTFHDPLDIYDHFKNFYGSIYMLIKQNFILIKFENIVVAEDLLKNTRQLVVKGHTLKIFPFDHVETELKPIISSQSVVEDLLN